jgi:hypothetical protein
VPDAVEALWQDVEQEPADELIGRERHRLLPVRTIAAIVFVAQSNAGLVERDQPSVRYCDAVRVTREICQDRFGTAERRLGIDHPALLSDGRQMAQERAGIGKLRQMAEEAELAAVVERHQPRQEQLYAGPFRGFVEKTSMIYPVLLLGQFWLIATTLDGLATPLIFLFFVTPVAVFCAVVIFIIGIFDAAAKST